MNNEDPIPPATRETTCAVIPAFREHGRIGDVVRGVKRHCDHVVVVDDGSSDGTAEEARAAGAEVIVHETNKGKGVSLNDGFRHAMERRYGFVVTLDGDGQHAPEDIPVFLETYTRTGFPVLVGNRMSDPKTMPLVRRLTNRFMSQMLSLQMGQWVPDTQCGYRLYRADVLPFLFAESGGYAAESEVLLDLAERGVRIGSAPIQVIYRDERSKIHPVRDTLRFFAMVRKHRRKKMSEVGGR